MSSVTNIILHWQSDLDIVELANRYFIEVEGAPVGFRGFVSLSDGPHWYGGSKALEANLAIGALNHLQLDRFVAYLHRMVPDPIPCWWVLQLIVKEQEDDRFRIIEIPDHVADEVNVAD